MSPPSSAGLLVAFYGCILWLHFTVAFHGCNFVVHFCDCVHFVLWLVAIMLQNLVIVICSHPAMNVKRKKNACDFASKHTEKKYTKK